MKILVTLAAIALFSLAIIGVATGSDRWQRNYADEQEHEREDDGSRRSGRSRDTGRDVAMADDPLYQEECGACHFAYQPGLLPAASWTRIMGTLEDHFGDNAELDPAVTAEIQAYLTSNAADRSRRSRSHSFAASIRGGKAPMRITETRYFRHEHDEVPAKWVHDNPEVISFSNCQACHRRADAGSYDEHQINIPGFGPWED